MDFRLPAPDATGFADVDGVQIAWQSFGDGEPAVLVVPTWNFVDSRVSARLVPDLAPWCRVVTFDPRGAGRSDRPSTGYRFSDHMADAVAVMRSAGVERASVIAASNGTNVAALLAARQPYLVDRLVLIDPAIAVGPEARSEDDTMTMRSGSSGRRIRAGSDGARLTGGRTGRGSPDGSLRRRSTSPTRRPSSRRCSGSHSRPIRRC